MKQSKFVSTHTRKLCTFCNKVGLVAKGDNICTECVAEIDALDVEFRAREAELTKYKCQTCGVHLPKSRRFNCVECLPESLPDDDYIYFDDFDAVDNMRPRVNMAAEKAKKFPHPRECKGCRTTKPAEEFALNICMAKGRINYCRPCQAARVKGKEQTHEVSEVC